MQIKSWKKFQHFKDRKPPWVKLYRDILDDMEWYQLPGEAAKLLIMLWLIASENDGVLPDIKMISFRLRKDISTVTESISYLNHWIEGIDDELSKISNKSIVYQDDIKMISSRYRSDSVETETETETETKPLAEYSAEFVTFWNLYPRKIKKDSAYRAWKKIKSPVATLGEIKIALDWQKKTEDWTKSNGQFIPHPASYLNGGGWKDENPDAVLQQHQQPYMTPEQIAIIKETRAQYEQNAAV